MRPKSHHAELARINAKERETRRVKKRKGIEAPRVKHPTPSQAIDTIKGEEERNGREKKNRERVPNPVNLDHSVAYYDPQGSYGECMWGERVVSRS